MADVSGHAARDETADTRMSIDVVLPDHRPSGEVGLLDESAIWHEHPFVVYANAILSVIGFPIRFGDNVGVRIRTALSEFALQTLELRFERRSRIAPVISRKYRGRQQQQ